MPQYIDKDALVAEIDKRIKNHILLQRKIEMSDLQDELQNKIDCLKSLKGYIFNTLEVKEVDLNKEIESYFKGFGKYPSVGIDDCIDIAKHFFELGMRFYNPITAADRGIAEEIIINLKRVEQDYRINLTREIEWLKSRVKKGE